MATNSLSVASVTWYPCLLNILMILSHSSRFSSGPNQRSSSLCAMMIIDFFALVHLKKSLRSHGVFLSPAYSRHLSNSIESTVLRVRNRIGHLCLTPNDHSQTSYLGYLAGNLLCWCSTDQGSISTSTAESEIKAVNPTLKAEVIANRGILKMMGWEQEPTKIEEDN
jgi:hypothetical protein